MIMAVSQSTLVERSFSQKSLALASTARAPLEDRLLTVADHRPSERLRTGAKSVANKTIPSAVPFLRLQGRWLEKAGFPKGTKVRVNVTSGCLVIKPIAIISERPPRLPRDGTFYL